MTIAIPARVPWDLHRIALSGRYPDSLFVISTEWSLNDVADANDILDAFDDAGTD